MNIREYTPADETACHNIFTSNIPKYFAIEEEEKLGKWLHALNTNTVPYSSAQSVHFYVLEDTDKIIGAAGFYMMKDENKAQLNWGMVNHDYHHKGFGKVLFDYRINKIREMAPARQITTWTSQYTYKFYEKLGMKVESITPNGFDYGFDKYVMYLP